MLTAAPATGPLVIGISTRAMFDLEEEHAADQVGVFARLREGRTYLMHVPGVIGSSLADSEIAELMNYMMETWAGPSLPTEFVPFSASEVAALRAADIGNVVKYRRETVARLLAAMGPELPDYPWP